MTVRAFPPGFLWGAATSAAQIEGSVTADGRGESIWDRFAARPGTIEDGSTPGVACDHYRRWREDLALLRWLGLGAYRFSVAWPRVQPSGRGPVSEAGLDFYDALVDALLDADIAPFVTLYHWDLPQALEDEGGWGNRATADAFEDYARVVAARLGDRVRHWATHNEPWCIATLGHENGVHAPGHRDPALALRVAHHLLVSHGLAARALRDRNPAAEVGIVLNLTPADPLSGSAADSDAARRFDGFFNRWYLDPLFRGEYPADAVADRIRNGHLPADGLPFVEPGDLDLIATPLDYLGVNYYSRVVVRADAAGNPVAVPVVPAGELTDMGWEVYPEGLEAMLLRLRDEYAPRAMFITENGAAYTDARDASGRIPDQRRVDYFAAHLAAAHRAIEAGVPLRGYFAWSLLDNFEWSHGYARRFGLFEVDYETQARTPRQSASWYRDVIRANGVADARPGERFAAQETRRIP